MPDQILPGLYHWTAFHEGIGRRVSSYYYAYAATLIDPMIPEEGLDWLGGMRPPDLVVLTNHHHYRHSSLWERTYSRPVYCHESGVPELQRERDVRGFAFGDELASGVLALEVGAICPDETALHLAAGEGALAFADGLIRSDDGSLSFPPDSLMGDDPEGVKRGLRASLGRLLERDFDSLLFAHGQPLVGGGKEALREFVEDGAG